MGLLGRVIHYGVGSVSITPGRTGFDGGSRFTIGTIAVPVGREDFLHFGLALLRFVQLDDGFARLTVHVAR